MKDSIYAEPKIDERELPLIGKTYSLYDDELTSDGYYSEIRRIVDEILKRCNHTFGVVDLIDNMSRRKHPHKKFSNHDNELISSIIYFSHRLSKYTYTTKSHLNNLGFFQRFDKTLKTTEDQYHLYMIAIELINRLNINDFKKSDIKVAFLPHCLHDLSKDCLSESDGVDYVCKKCSKKCYINAVTRILETHNVKAYIWREVNLKALFAKLRSQNKRVGVMGIACVAELMNGMSMCMKLDIPVVGVPLDANRCRRWMGEFHTTSVNLNKLQTLLS